jgi:polyhydroxybutyrate depolymerase
VTKAITLAAVLGAFGSGALGVALETTQLPPKEPTNLRIVPASAGCNVSGKQTGDFHFSTTDGRGTSRDYEVIVPSNYSPSTAWVVTFVYHGAGQNQVIAKSYGLQDAPGAESSFFVFPQGVNYLTYGIGWDDSSAGYDMIFFDHMLTSLEDNYCIDARRVFAAGFSWGCDQVTALTCTRGDRIRAVGVASCTDEFGNPSDYRTYQTCPVKNSTAAIRFTHDASGGDSGYPSPLFTTTSALYRSFNSCSSSATPISPSPCSSYIGCASPFVECPYSGLGHALPANWAADTWTFFSGFH